MRSFILLLVISLFSNGMLAAAGNTRKVVKGNQNTITSEKESHGEIKGVVLDKKTREPLAGVNITVEGTRRGTTTNQNGEFSISQILAGKWTLIFDYIGYTREKYDNIEVIPKAAAAAPRAVEAARARANRANQVALADIVAKTTVRDKVMAGRKSTAEELARANADLELAQAAATARQLAGEVEIQAAVDAQKIAEREAKLAEEIAAQLAADLDRSQRKTGVQVPADEIVFIPSLPVRVEQVNVVVGDAASGLVMIVTNNKLAIDSSLPLGDAPLVKPGMVVAIDEPALGIRTTGVVTRVADAPGTDGVDGYHIYFEILVEETPTALEGFSLRLTIPIKTTGGAVTAVPVSALSLAADGTSRVQVQSNGALEFIVVEPGLAADGFVEVTPLDGTLAPGQLVVVGYENYDD